MLPLPKVNSLGTMKIDASTLFSLFAISSTGQNMEFFDFDKQPIVSSQQTNKSKNALFGSFFDLKKLKKVCGGYKMKFAHSMRLLPGLRIMRVSGYKLNSLDKEREQKKPTEQSKTELKLIQAKEDLQQAKRQMQLLRSNNVETEDPVIMKNIIDNTGYIGIDKERVKPDLFVLYKSIQKCALQRAIGFH
ncbi:hypothetical protein EDC94DRAFT_671309 [Helicostylum pulchrum]|nr:hypothetical protein EDC94DRAFT_671309 [Helicostylum pulchrum]